MLRAAELAQGRQILPSGAARLSGQISAIKLSTSSAENAISYKINLVTKVLSQPCRKLPTLISAIKRSQKHSQKRVEKTKSYEDVKQKTSPDHVSLKAVCVNESNVISKDRSTVSTPDRLLSGSEKLPNSTREDLKALFWKIQSNPVGKENVHEGQKNYNSPLKSYAVKSEGSVHSSSSKEAILSVFRKFRDKPKQDMKEKAVSKQLMITKKNQVSDDGPSRKLMKQWSKKTDELDVETSGQNILSRPPSKFVRRSPIPLSAIRKEVRPVPLLQKLEQAGFHPAKSLSSGNGSFLSHLPLSSDRQLYDLDKCKLSELKKLAKCCGLKGYSKLKKTKLLEILKDKTKQY